jgi:hypothetical protein
MESRVIIIKSGNKEKSINSYIKKVCEDIIQADSIELKAYGINLIKKIII